MQTDDSVHSMPLLNGADISICPWCCGLTAVSETDTTICDCCGNAINEEDFNNDADD